MLSVSTENRHDLKVTRYIKEVFPDGKHLFFYRKIGQRFTSLPAIIESIISLPLPENTNFSKLLSATPVLKPDLSLKILRSGLS